MSCSLPGINVEINIKQFGVQKENFFTQFFWNILKEKVLSEIEGKLLTKGNACTQFYNFSSFDPFPFPYF